MALTNFPSGRTFVADYGDDHIFQLEYLSPGKLRWTGLAGEYKAHSETVDMETIEVRPQLFQLSWQEGDQTIIVHLEDFEKGVSHTTIVLPDRTIVRLSGKLTEQSPKV